MNKSNLLYFISFALLVAYSCSPKVTSKSSVTYKEDLSSYAPSPDSLVDDGEEVKIKTDEELRGAYVAPKSDITKEINAYLDSTALKNLENKVTFYTIQVYSGPNREEANNSRQKVYRILPEEMPKLEYIQPNYKVKVGKYIDRIDAHKTYATLKKAFPGAILVPQREYLDN